MVAGQLASCECLGLRAGCGAVDVGSAVPSGGCAGGTVCGRRRLRPVRAADPCVRPTACERCEPKILGLFCIASEECLVRAVSIEGPRWCNTVSLRIHVLVTTHATYSDLHGHL